MMKTDEDLYFYLHMPRFSQGMLLFYSAELNFELEIMNAI